MLPVRRVVRAGGHRLAYSEAGPADGPALVLLHGLASDSGTWDRALPLLAAHGLRAIAVDLLGHGDSDKPPGEYLLDDFADSLDAFFAAVGVERATIVGHSLGGAIAVHFGDEYPGRIDRLVLVSAGGLGREVHLMLRAASLPVAPAVVRAALRPRLRRLYASPRLHRALRLTPDNVVNLRRAARAFSTRAGQDAFFAAVRGVIEPSGQRGSFIEMQKLAEHVPTLIVWNLGDPVIPVAHARAAHEHLASLGALSGRLVVFPDPGHEPHRRDAVRFADEVARFVAST